MTRLHDPSWHGFASDNYAGAHPEVLAAIAEANEGHQVAYGEDVYTARLQEVVKAHFGDQAEAFPVFNGTGANVTALTSMLPRWGAVVTTTNAHIHTDENAAPERMSGLKLLTVPTPDGKLTPELIDTEAWGWGDEHRAQPLAVSITQSTELGTVYSIGEVRAIADHAHALGMRVHMDGARVANAAASLGARLREFTTDAGVDVLSFGGTKNGLLYGEAVVVLNPEASDGLIFLRKLSMQLASKMRFVSAQLIALLEGDLWMRSAVTRTRWPRGCGPPSKASLPCASRSPPRPTRSSRSCRPVPQTDLRERFRFYDWNPATGEVRWMTAFDTTEADVDAFAAAIRAEVGA